MKLVAKIRLYPNKEQEILLLATLERANDCANWVSKKAWATKTFRAFSLHGVAYHEARERFQLSAQVTSKVLAKVGEAYLAPQKKPIRFNRRGAITYDNRILTYGDEMVSIWLLGGREPIRYAAGTRQKELLKTRHGLSDLILHRGKWYLAANCEVTDPDPLDVDDYLGVDLGVVMIATDSDGQAFSGSHIGNARYRHRKLRTNLQKCGSKSAKRHLKKLSGREHGFATNTNHCIAKQIVEKAKRTNRGIALEELTGIHARVRARRTQRAILKSWSFAQLRAFITYKAVMAGIPVVGIDPRNTSRECSSCHHTEKSNRPSQAKFRCRSCGYATNADYNAAQNIASRAKRQMANRGEMSSAARI